MVFRRKGRVAACALGAVLLCLLVVPMANSASSRAKVSSKTALSNQIVREVNRVRATHGLRPLVLSSQLKVAASTHSRSMATGGFFTHESADGSAFWRRVQRFYPASGFHYWAVGENLVWASPNLSAKQTVRMWMKSSPHRVNLLSKRWQQIGLSAVHSSSAPGLYKGRAATIVTADFGVRR